MPSGQNAYKCLGMHMIKNKLDVGRLQVKLNKRKENKKEKNNVTV